jgi:exopolysaccharide biosynthesis WecB/TagA/CpsF family protein
VTAIQPQRTTESLAGISVERTTLDEAVVTFVRRVTSGGPPQAHRLVNAYTIALADTDPAYKRLLAHSGVNLPDGKPLVTALNRLDRAGQPFGQVRGPSFFVRCLDAGRAKGVRHLFLGGSPALLDLLKAAVERRFPGVQIVGMISPPFRPLTDVERADQDREIKASGAQVVWVGLGTPKQGLRGTEDLRLTRGQHGGRRRRFRLCRGGEAGGSRLGPAAESGVGVPFDVRASAPLATLPLRQYALSRLGAAPGPRSSLTCALRLFIASTAKLSPAARMRLCWTR